MAVRLNANDDDDDSKAFAIDDNDEEKRQRRRRRRRGGRATPQAAAAAAAALRQPVSRTQTRIGPSSERRQRATATGRPGTATGAMGLEFGMQRSSSPAVVITRLPQMHACAIQKQCRKNGEQSMMVSDGRRRQSSTRTRGQSHEVL